MDVVVEYDYVAKEDDELTIRKGDVIHDVIQFVGGWWEGTLRGKKGMFPDNFIKVIMPTNDSNQESKKEQPAKKVNKSCRRYRVLYSYLPTHADELALKVDDAVEFLEESEEGWYKGRLNGKVGMFPSNFVEAMDQAADSGGGGDAPQIPKGKAEKRESRKKKHLSGQISTDDETPKQHSDDSTDLIDDVPKLPPKPAREVARVIYSYEAQNDDELSLIEGEFVSVYSKDVEDKGWWRGEVRGKMGVFPDNFVEIVPQILSNLKTEEENLEEELTKTNSHGTPDDADSGTGGNRPIKSPGKTAAQKEADFDQVQRSEMLTHPTATRVKAPKRRPPSSVLIKEENDHIMNGNTEVGEEEDLVKMNHIEHKEIPKERKVVPWMEELKKSQARRSRELVPGKEDSVRGPSPNRKPDDQVDKKVPSLPSKPLLSKQDSGVGGVPTKQPVVAVRQDPGFLNKQEESMAKIKYFESPLTANATGTVLNSGGITKPKYPSPPVQAVVEPDILTDEELEEVKKEAQLLKETNDRLTNTIHKLQESMDGQHREMMSKLEKVLGELEHEKKLRISLQKKIQRLM